MEQRGSLGLQRNVSEVRCMASTSFTGRKCPDIASGSHRMRVLQKIACFSLQNQCSPPNRQTTLTGACRSECSCNANRRCRCQTTCRGQLTGRATSRAASPPVVPETHAATSTSAGDRSGATATLQAQPGFADDTSSSSSSNGSAAKLPDTVPLVCAPEDLVLESGELSTIDRTSSSCHPADVFRCTGCSEAACKVCSCLNMAFMHKICAS